MSRWNPFSRGDSRQRSAEALASRWLESTLQVARWEHMLRSGRRWGTWGGVVGALLGAVWFAPASWLADALTQATSGRLVLADAQGTVWTGDAVLVLSGGAGSRGPRALPGRLSWQLRPQGGGLNLRVSQDCCLPASGPLDLLWRAGWRRVTVQVKSGSGTAVQGVWPAAWLTGLGTPWNTLALQGSVRLSAQAVVLEWTPSGVRLQGRVVTQFTHLASRLTTLPSLGSYTLSLQESVQTPGRVSVDLRTDEGPLQLLGSGTLDARGLSFRGQAQAAEAEREALNNLLNIIGRRQGELSVISIG